MRMGILVRVASLLRAVGGTAGDKAKSEARLAGCVRDQLGYLGGHLSECC